MLDKAEGIEQQGFDFGKVRIILAQMPLEAEGRKAIFDKNQQWLDEDNRYPAWQESQIEYTALGGNHLVGFLKMARQGVEADSFCSVASPDGKSVISTTLLRQMDSDFARAVEGTVRAIILRRQVRNEPGAVLDIQASENCGHTLNTLETDKQCILRCANRILGGSVTRSLRCELLGLLSDTNVARLAFVLVFLSLAISCM